MTPSGRLSRFRRRSGSLRRTFPAPSNDQGYSFEVEVAGFWEERTKTAHQNPESVLTTDIIERVRPLAEAVSLLDAELLQHRANALLGQPVDLPEHHLRLLGVQVRVHAHAADVAAVRDALRRRHALQRADEATRLKMERVTMFRDSLREDPSLALALMLLENRTTLTSETLQALDHITERVAASSPHAEAVVIAGLLREFVAGLQPDAKKHIANRLCTTLTEYGGDRQAEKIRATLQAE
jgi:hypothetical protein